MDNKTRISSGRIILFLLHLMILLQALSTVNAEDYNIHHDILDTSEEDLSKNLPVDDSGSTSQGLSHPVELRPPERLDAEETDGEYDNEWDYNSESQSEDYYEESRDKKEGMGENRPREANPGKDSHLGASPRRQKNEELGYRSGNGDDLVDGNHDETSEKENNRHRDHLRTENLYEEEKIDNHREDNFEEKDNKRNLDKEKDKRNAEDKKQEDDIWALLNQDSADDDGAANDNLDVVNHDNDADSNNEAENQHAMTEPQNEENLSGDSHNQHWQGHQEEDLKHKDVNHSNNNNDNNNDGDDHFQISGEQNEQKENEANFEERAEDEETLWHKEQQPEEYGGEYENELEEGDSEKGMEKNWHPEHEWGEENNEYKDDQDHGMIDQNVENKQTNNSSEDETVEDQQNGNNPDLRSHDADGNEAVRESETQIRDLTESDIKTETHLNSESTDPLKSGKDESWRNPAPKFDSSETNLVQKTGTDRDAIDEGSKGHQKRDSMSQSENEGNQVGNAGNNEESHHDVGNKDMGNSGGDIPQFNKGYIWVTGAWSDCKCGDGFRSRKVDCRKASDWSVAFESFCGSIPKPSTTTSCPIVPCNGRWKTLEWTKCSQSCQAGVQSRELLCIQDAPGTDEQVLDASYCPLDRPITARTCNDDVPCPKWSVGQWSACNAVCGRGEQTRQVSCKAQHDVEEAMSRILPDQFCDATTRPETGRVCQAGPCHGAEWMISQWSGCQAPCNMGTESRLVLCVSKEGQRRPDVECNMFHKPHDGRDCTANQSLCFHEGPQWFTSEWSTCIHMEGCSVGRGRQYRTVLCISVNASGHVTNLLDTQCVAHLPPARRRDCDLNNNNNNNNNDYNKPEQHDNAYNHEDKDRTGCAGVWLYGPYGKCTVKCGRGSREREIMCWMNDESVDIDFCDPASKPNTTETCNLQPCSGNHAGEKENCQHSTFGCCPDQVTTAEGWGYLGCPSNDPEPHGLCFETEFGCCLDGITPANGPFNLGCILPTCQETQYGCCSDGKTPAGSQPDEGCPQSISCMAMAFGCCPDGKTPANGPMGEGCDTSSADYVTYATADPDDIVTEEHLWAADHQIQGDGDIGPPSGNGTIEDYEGSGDIDCMASLYGCCEDGITPASGENYTGCAKEKENLSNEMACSSSDYGCCRDGQTPANGPDFQGCPESTTMAPLCLISVYGCCPDGITKATGPNNRGCFLDFLSCDKTKFGCCFDNATTATGPNGEGCPVQEPACSASVFGCCPDYETEAMGPNYEGCAENSTTEETMTIEITTQSTTRRSTATPLCAISVHGCCPDGISKATGPDYKGCFWYECEMSQFGCCPNRKMSATGPNYEGCMEEVTTEEMVTLDTTTQSTTRGSTATPLCAISVYGCCPDGISKATGPDFKGCFWYECEMAQFGCCQDRKTSATGPDYQGCPEISTTQKPSCLDSQFGCCSDGLTAAEGPQGAGCPIDTHPSSCELSEFGCCADDLTPAQGLNFEGCESSTAQTTISDLPACFSSFYGCCSDNLTQSGGPNFEGCPESTTLPPADCIHGRYRCCLDGRTRALGPDFEGCPQSDLRYVRTCVDTPYGCCPDQHTPAQGPHHAGCPSHLNKARICSSMKETGPCSNYTVKWYFDASYGDCGRFWYGGCEGTENRFETREECRASCLNPPGVVDRCYLPQAVGRCRGTLIKYYHNPETGQCVDFVYGGCLGNDNRFDSLAECETACVDQLKPDVCSQPVQRGPCHGSFTRWYFDKATETCRRFDYGGCMGNDNQFSSEAECHEHCKSTAFEVCHMTLDPGPCQAEFYRWYFNPHSGQCEEFVYTGCGGNANRFISRDDCEKSCKEYLKDKSTNRCSLPPMEGPCKEYFVQWYHDPSDRYCKSFVYGGCEGNENRFESEELCRQSCDANEPVDVCTLRANAGPCTDTEQRYHFNVITKHCELFTYGGCGGNYNNFATLADCEKKCSEHIKDSLIPGSDRCSLPRDPGPCLGSMLRWHYSSAEDRCVMFEYGGCEGNRNRFLSEDLCNQVCRREITTEPTTTIQTTEQSTTVSSDLTSAYKGDDAVTMPPTDACNQPRDAGQCLGHVISWYFDSLRQRCSQFVYGGCGGNENRFESMKACEARCVQQYASVTGLGVCSMRPEKGPCSDHVTRWYYDQEKGECLEFTYGGCYGNDNRFHTRDHCLAACPVDDICRLPSSAGSCGATKQRYHYDVELGSCVQFSYGGCNGNANRFLLPQNCEKTCSGVRPQSNGVTSVIQVSTTPALADETVDLCTLPRDQGPCLAYVTSFYYDLDLDQCMEFVWGGCGGNANRFTTLMGCQMKCEGTGDEKNWWNGDETTTTKATTTTTEKWNKRKETCSLRKDAGSCPYYEAMWYFDSDSSSCRRFLYGGCGGNENRFNSSQECREYCMGTGSWGEGGLTPSDISISTTPLYYETYTSTETYTNSHPVEQPATPESGGGFAQNPICQQPMDHGEYCTGWEIYWFYDVEGRGCNRFYYGGCSGNENRFSTQEECSEACERGSMQLPEVPTTSTTQSTTSVTTTTTVSHQGHKPSLCYEPLSKGLCDSRTLRYYWSESHHQCRPVNGCQGNENSFTNQEACYETCGDDISQSGARIRTTNDCLEPVTAGPCNDAMPRWYYDVTQRICQAFYYGGCQGNGNNFLDYDDCIAFCGNVEVKRCVDIEDTCDLDCPYGLDLDSRGCTVCSCALDPCQVHECPSSTVCRVEAAECTAKHCLAYQHKCVSGTKPGYCPMVNDRRFTDTHECFTECKVDLDCSEDQKCCIAGCSNVCIQSSLFQEAPVMQDDSLYLEAVRGDDVTLPCDVTGAPPPTRTWTKNGQPIVDVGAAGYSRLTVTRGGASLVIRRVTVDDSAEYVCTGENNAGQASVRHTLQVNVPPAIIGDVPDGYEYRLSIGEMIRLQCPTSGMPVPVVTWSSSNGQLENSIGTHFHQSGDVLQIQAARIIDSGVYTCSASNGVGVAARKSFVIIVSKPLEVRITSDKARYSLGDKISLQCHISSSEPQPKMTATTSTSWLHQGNPLLVDGLRLSAVGERLDITRAKLEDSGSYACVVHQESGATTTSSYISITVEEPRKEEESCVDKPWYANCQLIMEAELCTHPYFSVFCCRTCRNAGLLRHR